LLAQELIFNEIELQIGSEKNTFRVSISLYYDWRTHHTYVRHILMNSWWQHDVSVFVIVFRYVSKTFKTMFDFTRG